MAKKVLVQLAKIDKLITSVITPGSELESGGFQVFFDDTKFLSNVFHIVSEFGIDPVSIRFFPDRDHGHDREYDDEEEPDISRQDEQGKKPMFEIAQLDTSHVVMLKVIVTQAAASYYKTQFDAQSIATAALKTPMLKASLKSLESASRLSLRMTSAETNKLDIVGTSKTGQHILNQHSLIDYNYEILDVPAVDGEFVIIMPSALYTEILNTMMGFNIAAVNISCSYNSLYISPEGPSESTTDTPMLYYPFHFGGSSQHLRYVKNNTIVFDLSESKSGVTAVPTAARPHHHPPPPQLIVVVEKKEKKHHKKHKHRRPSTDETTVGDDDDDDNGKRRKHKKHKKNHKRHHSSSDSDDDDIFNNTSTTQVAPPPLHHPHTAQVTQVPTTTAAPPLVYRSSYASSDSENEAIVAYDTGQTAMMTTSGGDPSVPREIFERMYNSTFSCKLLHCSVRIGSKFSDIVTLKLQSDKPLEITYEHPRGYGTISVYVAPKIVDDE